MVGIICEYNPLHNGHLHHLKEIKKRFPDEVITLVLAGNFLNRGEVSVLEKYDKTNLALDYVDLVVELPTVLATQAADMYAYGAISILDNLKCNYLVFGSESNDIEKLTKITHTILKNEMKIKKFMKQGYSYPASIGLALKKNSNIEINSPNDLLGISYLKAIIKLNSKIKPITIKRTTDYHNSLTEGKISSATSIRKLISNQQNIQNYVPHKTLNYIKNIDLNDFFLIIKYKILTEDLTIYQDIDFNLNNALKKNITKSTNIDQLIANVKSKNYTYNKIKRSLVHILCCIKKNNYKLEYIHILGFNQKGKKYLNKIKKEVKLPLITNYNDLLKQQILIDKIYALITNDIKPIKPIIKD